MRVTATFRLAKLHQQPVTRREHIAPPPVTVWLHKCVKDCLKGKERIVT